MWNFYTLVFIITPELNYSINGFNIFSVDHAHELEVIVDESLKFNLYFQSIVQRSIKDLEFYFVSSRQETQSFFLNMTMIVISLCPLHSHTPSNRNSRR